MRPIPHETPRMNEGRILPFGVIRPSVIKRAGSPLYLEDAVAGQVLLQHFVDGYIGFSRILRGQCSIKVLHVLKQLLLVLRRELRRDGLILIQQHIGTAEAGDKKSGRGLKRLVLHDGIAVRLGGLERLSARQ